MPIANVAQYRKSVGTYNNKPRPLSEKSIRKAIRKARRSHESISTQSSSCNTSSNGSSAVRTLLMVGIAASLIGASAAISNGQSREGSEVARATFPFLGRSTSSGLTYCSSVRLNSRQLLTAKHCAGREVQPWAWTDNLWGWDWAVDQLDYPDSEVDLSLLTFDTDLRGEAYCLPIMSKNNQELLKNSPKTACGLNGPIIVLGNGVSDNNVGKCLRSAVFDFHGMSHSKDKTSTMIGIRFNDKHVQTNGGDSGSAVLGCNLNTKGYELMGVNVAGDGYDKKDGKYSWFVDIAGYAEISDWIKNNTKLHACSGEVVKSDELYNDQDHNLEHSNKCNGAFSLYSILSIALPTFSVVGFAGLGVYHFCQKRKQQNFQTVSTQPSTV